MTYNTKCLYDVLKLLYSIIIKQIRVTTEVIIIYWHFAMHFVVVAYYVHRREAQIFDSIAGYHKRGPFRKVIMFNCYVKLYKNIQCICRVYIRFVTLLLRGSLGNGWCQYMLNRQVLLNKEMVITLICFCMDNTNWLTLNMCLFMAI